MSPARTTGGDVLSSRQLNRASFARQLLLERSPIGVTAAVEQVGGLNAQEPNPPYLALWSRLETFTRESMFELVEQRALVRSPVVRGTQRLVSADDLRWMRPALAPTLAQGQRSTFARLLVGLDLDQLMEYTTAMLHERPRTGSEIRKLLVERFPGYDRSALAYSAQYLVATVAMPEVSRWGNRKRITHALAEDWIGRPLDPRPGVAELVRRYLAASGRPRRRIAGNGRGWLGCARCSRSFGRLFARSGTSPAGSCSTSPMPYGLTRTHPHRCGSCRCSTSCSWRTPTGPGS